MNVLNQVCRIIFYFSTSFLSCKMNGSRKNGKVSSSDMIGLKNEFYSWWHDIIKKSFVTEFDKKNNYP